MRMENSEDKLDCRTKELGRVELKEEGKVEGKK